MNVCFEKFGSSVRLTDGAGWYSPVYKAFLQPLRYKNKMYLEGTYTPIGRDNTGLYLYLVKNGVDISDKLDHIFALTFADFYGINEKKAVAS